MIDRIIELGTATLRRTEAEPESRDLYVAMLVAGPATGPAATKVFASMTNLLMGRLRECVDEAKQLGYFGDLSSDAVTVTILGFSTTYMLPYSTCGKPDWPEVIGQLELADPTSRRHEKTRTHNEEIEPDLAPDGGSRVNVSAASNGQSN